MLALGDGNMSDQSSPPSKQARSVALTILKIVFGVVLLLHGLCSGLIWFMALIEHGGDWKDYSLSAAMFLGSLAEAGVGVMLNWWALRQPSKQARSTRHTARSRSIGAPNASASWASPAKRSAITLSRCDRTVKLPPQTAMRRRLRLR